MHSVLSTRILLHVRQAAQSNAFDIGLTDLQLTTAPSTTAVVGELPHERDSVHTATLALSADDQRYTPSCHSNRQMD